MESATVPLHRKQMADETRAKAIVSAVRYELEQQNAGFVDTHGPDDDGWVYFAFDASLKRAEAERHLRAALDAVAESDWEAHLEFQPDP